ncbi:large conductance mechanosensitive channel protein MscL [Candidatus Roizmanbacteria bacterium CG_4_10_14_0_8_um_filter_33_9]|uniref:Large conductance mechanosensitive channel protein MscL n=1 Tax=Candidatus Roizmanbacteria bacterium CG_4_10_14_0_8_um_filter_33_9 TaxID=1974826 RepID=A0A2M7QH32_9BACT|nr:MAG: large conductance mechanosensitive channel protein MscL [Candidatus Roizmanbacteria bacterium CG_4_10_14_0_8_um_filter_33_9]
MKTELKGMSEKSINQLHGFIDFIIERGVIGLAIGFILGGAVTKVVSSLVTDLINPIVGLILGSTKGLEGAKIDLLGAKILYGHFLSTTLDFLIVAVVVYFMVKILGLGKLDKKK